MCVHRRKISTYRDEHLSGDFKRLRSLREGEEGRREEMEFCLVFKDVGQGKRALI